MQSRLLLLGVLGGLGDVASRCVRLLLRQVVRGRPGGERQRLEVRLMHAAGVTDSGDTVNIGDVSYKLKTPKNPELVPQNYISESPAQSIVQHLRWIMQKDLLGQDIFLIGPPGPLRRSVAMQYLELTKREVEYIALSRDTTETDLKQRREIRAGTAFYIDQGDEMSQQLCHWKQRKLEQFCIINTLSQDRDTAHMFGFNSYTSNIPFLPNVRGISDLHRQQRQTVGGKKAQ